MINNNFNEPGTYVSPAVKVTQINVRRVMCTSPGYGVEGQAGKSVTWGEYYDEF